MSEHRSSGPAEFGGDGASIEDYCSGEPTREELMFQSFDSAVGDGVGMELELVRRESPQEAPSAHLSSDCTPFSSDQFNQTDSLRERDERARGKALDGAIKKEALDSMPADREVPEGEDVDG